MTTPPHPLFSLQGQVALITGAGSAEGIGFATAQLLGELGCPLAICATSERIHQRVAELQGQGFKAHGYVADLSDDRQVAELVRQVQDDLGAIDILVNNAGMAQQGQPEHFQAFHTLSAEQWHADLRRNLDTCAHTTRHVLPLMRARRHGRIINVASVTGPLVANPGEVGYSAAKAAMVGFSRALALETGEYGITVNCVAPGWVATAATTAEEAQAAQHTPMGRAGTPREMAGAIAFLAMPAASYIHGEMLVIDGANCLQERKG